MVHNICVKYIIVSDVKQAVPYMCGGCSRLIRQPDIIVRPLGAQWSSAGLLRGITCSCALTSHGSDRAVSCRRTLPLEKRVNHSLITLHNGGGRHQEARDKPPPERHGILSVIEVSLQTEAHVYVRKERAWLAKSRKEYEVNSIPTSRWKAWIDVPN